MFRPYLYRPSSGWIQCPRNYIPTLNMSLLTLSLMTVFKVGIYFLGHCIQPDDGRLGHGRNM